MKKNVFLLIALFFSLNTLVVAQDEISPENKRGPVIYTGFVNIVPAGFNFPLIGFVNIAKGSHHGAQVSFININQKKFNGAQIGFINIDGSDFKGAQTGFVNTVAGKVDGMQIGFVNTVVDDTKGTQLGFVNSVKKLNGFQLGFVNFADTVSKGAPFGFVSIVRKGGYQALEVGVTEMFPLNVSFKLGVRKLYTTFTASYNKAFEKNYAFGLGFGTILPVSKSIYINPELESRNTVGKNNQQFTSFVTYLGYTFSRKIEIVAGPSLVWNYSFDQLETNEPVYSVYNDSLSENNKLIGSFRFAVRFNFSSGLPAVN